MDFPYSKQIEKIIACDDAPFNGKNFAISNGKRHWINSKRFYDYNGFDVDDREDVPFFEVFKIPLSSPIVAVDYIKQIEDCKNMDQARAFILKDYKGTGVQFDANINPLPVPICCNIMYTNRQNQSKKFKYSRSEDFVPLDFIDSFDTMENTPFNLDFILSDQSICLYSNPLKVIEQAYKHLKVGGKLFLTVPHKNYMFNRTRNLTNPDEIIQNYLNYSYERDAYNILDFIGNITEQTRSLIDPFTICQSYLEHKNCAVQYYTFVEKNFNEILEWFSINVYKWNNIKIIPRIDTIDFIEFYIELTK